MIRSPLAHAFVLSPNVEARRGNRAVDMMLLHYTGMASAEAACQRLCDARSGVSCHYLVDEEGHITQMVGEEMRAWHAGASVWEGETDINSRSIGIEICNPGHLLGYRDFPAAQMQAVAALARDILARHAIAPQRVLAHSDVAPARKMDPGERFDWKFLSGQGIGLWVEPAPSQEGEAWTEGHLGEHISQLQRQFADFGYGIGTSGHYDGHTAYVVTAFQRHFRPARVDGIADPSTRATLAKLLRSLPAKRYGQANRGTL